MKRFKKGMIMILSLILCMGIIHFGVFAEDDPDEGIPTEVTGVEIEGSEVEEEELYHEVSWDEVLQKGALETEETVVLTRDLVVATDKCLYIRGDLVIESGVTLTNEGLLAIEDGSVIVSEGASLVNNFFLRVAGSGKLDVKGQYAQSDTAGFVWEDLDGSSSVEGVKKELIDKTVYANSLKSLQNLSDRDGYRTMTVTVSEMMIVKELYGDILNGIVLSAQ